MYYLKYRPKTIDEIDNTKARETITTLLSHPEKLPHAFLFVGQKGTGKTSTARIFAKVVCCSNNLFAGKSKSIEPCNKCENCLRIDASTSTDVTELDAASNRGIEEIKSLIRESSFAPMTSRYRVFIIDEAHMITTEAFNALLKTLEEPPPSVLFILATTNEDKIPKTIQSRCLKVVFGKARKEDIIRQLNRIAIREKQTFDPKLMELIAHHSDYSFRDAAKLLEELSLNQKLDYESARAYIGVRSKDSLLLIIKDKSLTQALQWIEEFSQTGGNFKNLIEELMEQLRIQLLLKNGIKISDEAELSLTVKEITQLMKLLSDAYIMLRSTPIESLPLEIALVEFYNRKNSS